MSNTINILQGMRDILPQDVYKWQFIEQTALETAKLFGFSEIRTPVVEYTALFSRSVGDTTDVVQKEMYTFEDNGGRSISLRPEGTAGVVRSAIEHSLLGGNLPLKLAYNIRCYRAERPQRGRYREFSQFGVELLGSVAPAADAEVIALAHTFISKLGLSCSILLNSIGCPACRPQYLDTLRAYFQGNTALCTTCLDRLERNPLRILDCKNPACGAIIKEAPKAVDSLCPDCQTHFTNVKARLDLLDIPFELDTSLVRGLDYYTKTVFELVTQTKEGSLTIGGGGRYDGLVEMLGGGSAPGIGFAMGLDRILLTMESKDATFPQPASCALYIGTLSEEASMAATKLAASLRANNIICDYDTIGRSLKAQMRYANKLGALYTMILGEDELRLGTATLKRMSDGVSEPIALDDAFADAFQTISLKNVL